MYIKIQNHDFYIKHTAKSIGKVPIIFLHGFSGSSEDWSEISENIKTTTYSIDLIGHGKSASPDNISLYSQKSLAEILNQILDQLKLDEVILAGYSMGGRVALSYSLIFPEKIKGLILESTTAGIENRNERQIRIEADKNLAAFIEKGGIEDFVDHWINLPLFESQKKLSQKKLTLIRKQKLKNNIKGLANVLREFGTGVMPHYWKQLEEINLPVLLISGSLDAKFTKIARRMNSLIDNSKHIIIPDCGHNTHLERPDIFIDLINNFIDTI